ncbi:MAG: protein-disulfide reductase DsbD family protein [Planctomycetota bacterium]
MKATTSGLLLALLAQVLPAGQEPLLPGGDEGSLEVASARIVGDAPGEGVRAGERATLALEVVVSPGWHVSGARDEFGLKPSLTLDGKSPVEAAGELELPPGEEHEASGIKQFIIEGKFVLKQTVLVREGAAPGKLEANGQVEYQVCNESVCLPVASAPFRAILTVEAGPARADTSKPVQAEGAAPPDSASAGLLGFLLAAVAAGIFALVMPCTYPMIPITISFFTKQADQRGGNVLPLAITYGLGIILIFVLIGLTFAKGIIPFATNPITNLVIGTVFLLFAFALFGWILLQPPKFLMDFAGKASSKGGFLGVFLMGATLVVTSFTCSAPFIGTLLALGATSGEQGRVALGMAVFGLTMALPFVFLALVPGRIAKLPRAGEWMNTLKVFLGFVELAAALKFLSNAEYAWQLYILPIPLFLGLWALIFVGAGIYLFGVFRSAEQRMQPIGSVRRAAAGSTTTS